MNPSIDAELGALERDVTVIRIEYERFFSGDVKVQPFASRRKIEAWLKRLGNTEVDRAAERFRLQAVEGRYNALTELWDKRLRAREEGRVKTGKISVPQAARKEPVAPAGVPSPPPLDAPAPASVKRSGVDFTPLFERYRQAREALGEDVSRLRYERFEEQVRKQAEEIRRQTGAARLVFEVQTAGGKVRLVGRPAPQKV